MKIEKKYIYSRILSMLNSCIRSYRENKSTSFDIGWLHGFLEGIEASGIISCRGRFAISNWCADKYHKVM